MALEHHTETATWRSRSCYTAAGNAKRRYSTRSEAKRAAQRITRQEGVEMNEYSCWCCGHWHVGKRPEWLV